MLRLVLLALLWLAFVSHVSAARVMTITGNTSSLLGDDMLTVTASPSGFTDGETIYLKGAFFQSGTSNYFGFTKNEEVWVKNSASNLSQRQVKIGDWDGTIYLKVDFSDSGYKGEGEYPIKIRYYYGSSMTADWSANSLLVNISEPDPTITPTVNPTSTPTESPKLTSIPSAVPTSTCTPMTPTTVVARESPTPRHEVFESVTSDILGTSSGQIDIGESKSYAPQTGATTSAMSHSLRPLSIALSFIASGFALLSVVTLWHNIDIWKTHVFKDL